MLHTYQKLLSGWVNWSKLHTNQNERTKELKGNANQAFGVGTTVRGHNTQKLLGEGK